jgi:hypothetical protein
MSQFSQSSSRFSSVPSEISVHQDDEFIEELNQVDELYFASVNDSGQCDDDDDQNVADVSVHDESDNSDPDTSDREYDRAEVCTEPSATDHKERESQASFRLNTCGCEEFYGKPCSTQIPFEDMTDYRESCHELAREELDLVIMTALSTHRRAGKFTEGAKHKVRERQNAYQEYFFKGKRVCRKTFCFLHGIERKKLGAIAHSLDTEGLKPRVHGRVGQAPAHSLTFEDRTRIKTFLCKYAKDNALPLPGRLPNYKNFQVLLLPSDKTKENIFDMYEEVAVSMGYRHVGLRTFQRLWHELCPYIVVSKPCTDLCHTCQQFVAKISSGGNLDDTEKAAALEAYMAHVALAKQERDLYREQCSASKENYSTLPANLQSGLYNCTIIVVYD